MSFDPYIGKVSLLLKGDGSNAATTFVDSSLTPKTITASGNAQISTAQSRFGGSSIYFDGAGDCLNLGTPADMVISTKDFTIEGWIFINAYGGVGVQNDGTLVGCQASTGGFFVYANWSDGAIMWFDGSGVLSSPTPITLGTWTHFAVTRNSGTLRIFTGGELKATLSDYSYSIASAGVVQWRVGGNFAGDSSRYFNGYIDDLRITVGVARYTADFTPPTESFPTIPSPVVLGTGEDPYYSSVVLMVPGTGDNRSTTLYDMSPNRKTLTATGNAKVYYGQCKWGQGAAYFDGAGDYITVSNSKDFTLPCAGFTIEAWVWMDTLSTIDGSGIRSAGIFGMMNGALTNNLGFMMRGSSSTLADIVYLEYTVGGVNSTRAMSVSVPIGQWNHIAVVSDLRSVRFYINGNEFETTPLTMDFPYSSDSDICFGREFRLSTWERYLNGYMNDLRVSKVARYTKPFTPPTAPLPIKQKDFFDQYFDNTSLILSCDGDIGSTSIVDSSPVSNTVVAIGTAALNAVQAKFGDTSLYIDGTMETTLLALPMTEKTPTDQVGVPLTYYPGLDVTTVVTRNGSPVLDFRAAGAFMELGVGYRFDLSSSPFTLEFWCYPTVIGSGGIRRLYSSEGSTDVVVIREDGNTIRAYLKVGGSGYLILTGSTNFTINAWNHIALCRVGNVFTLYKNGVSIGTLTAAGTINLTTSGGFISHPGVEAFKGYISDLLFVKGVAKYNGTFTPPANAIPPELKNNSSYCEVAPSSAFDMGSGDFTYECWFNLATVVTYAAYATYAALMSQGWNVGVGYNGVFFGISNANPTITLNFHWGISSSAATIAKSAAFTPAVGTWYHAAAVRSAGFVTVYLNGVPGTPVAITNALYNANYPINIGMSNPGAPAPYPLKGWIDDVRITKGVARYLQAFTPSASPVPVIAPPTRYIRGTVRGPEGYPASRTIRIYRHDNGQYVTTIYSNPDTGYYEFGTTLDVEYTLVYLPRVDEVQNAIIRDRISPI